MRLATREAEQKDQPIGIVGAGPTFARKKHTTNQKKQSNFDCLVVLNSVEVLVSGRGLAGQAMMECN